MFVIGSGTFQMGSPETEAGRSDDEGPRHGVTIAALRNRPLRGDGGQVPALRDRDGPCHARRAGKGVLFLGRRRKGMEARPLPAAGTRPVSPRARGIRWSASPWTTRKPTSTGYRGAPGPVTACPRRPSGNTRHGLGPRRAITGAITRTPPAGSPTGRTGGRRRSIPTGKRPTATTAISTPLPPAATARTGSAYTTCRERLGMDRRLLARELQRRSGRRRGLGSRPAAAIVRRRVPFAAGRGSTIPVSLRSANRGGDVVRHCADRLPGLSPRQGFMILWDLCFVPLRGCRGRKPRAEPGGAPCSITIAYAVPGPFGSYLSDLHRATLRSGKAPAISSSFC